MPDRVGAAQRRLRRLQRQAARRRGPDRRTGVTPSGRWRRTNAKIARLHARITNARTNDLHQLTTALAQRFAVIVIEDLNVVGMLANRRLARRISAAGWGELRRQLDHKTRDGGGRLVVADRFYPSSKTCSNCGAVKTKLRPSQRIYDCDSCSIYPSIATSTPLRTWPHSQPAPQSRLPRVAGRRQTSPLETRTRPASLAASTATGSPPRTTPHEQSHGSC